MPTKLEPGNASYELAYSSAGIVEYLVGLGGTDAAASDRTRIAAAFRDITDHEMIIGEQLLDYLRDRKDCRIIGRTSADDAARVPTISFKVTGRDSGEIARGMDEHRIAIRFGDFHARRLIEFLGLEPDGGVVRVSMTHYNTTDEVAALVAALDSVLAG